VAHSVLQGRFCVVESLFEGNLCLRERLVESVVCVADSTIMGAGLDSSMETVSDFTPRNIELSRYLRRSYAAGPTSIPRCPIGGFKHVSVLFHRHSQVLSVTSLERIIASMVWITGYLVRVIPSLVRVNASLVRIIAFVVWRMAPYSRRERLVRLDWLSLRLLSLQGVSMNGM
jgi:hypothetical protein